jgi:Ser/Thr protein kinase RdoA (MazF antagonist)
MAERRPSLTTVQAAAENFGADPDALHLINAGVNTVYRAGDVALRLCSASFKDRAYLTPPLDWLRHLHANNAAVCEPLCTPAGEWIAEGAEGDTLFLATATRWVPGPRLSELPPTPALYREYGHSIGRLQWAGLSFVAAPDAPHMLLPGTPGVYPRWDWLWARAARHAGGMPVLARAFERLTPLVEAWSAEQSVMTHGDLRPGNVIWDGARAVIIDFDEPLLGPAALDLTRAAMEVPDAERPALTAALLEGYRLEQPLEPVWDDRLPTLMAARAALMAAWNAEDGQLGSGSGSGAAVSMPRLLEWLEKCGY